MYKGNGFSEEDLKQFVTTTLVLNETLQQVRLAEETCSGFSALATLRQMHEAAAQQHHAASRANIETFARVLHPRIGEASPAALLASDWFTVRMISEIVQGRTVPCAIK